MVSKKLKKNKTRTKKQKGKVKKLILHKKISDEKIKEKEGDYFSEKDFPYIIKEDTDVYGIDNGKKKLLGRNLI